MNAQEVYQLFLPLFFVLGRVFDTEDGASAIGDDKLFLHVDLISCEAVRFSDGIFRDIIDDTEAIQRLVGVDLVDLVIADAFSEVLMGG
jgi:hypothetical protein